MLGPATRRTEVSQGQEIEIGGSEVSQKIFPLDSHMNGVTCEILTGNFKCYRTVEDENVATCTDALRNEGWMRAHLVRTNKARVLRR